MSTVQDIRFALRQLRRAPGFTATVLLTLALVIGATTAMVSVLRATLLNPTPYPGASQLVVVEDVNLKGVKSNGIMTVPRAADLAQAPAADGVGRLFSGLSFYYFSNPSLKVGGQPPVATKAVSGSGNLFQVLGTAPMLGRTFTPSDDAQGAPETAVISYGLWQRVFAGDPGIAGRSVLLAGKPTTIVGVMPRAFHYPTGIDLWAPAHLTAQSFGGYRGQGARFVQVLGRLAGITTAARAQHSADLVAARLARSYAATDADWGFRVTSMRTEILGSYRQALLLLSSAVGILLLIACANVAGLALSRNAARQPEMALRRALGVSSARLVRQLLTESLVLLGAGAALGIAMAAGLLKVLAARLPEALLSFATPRLDRVTLSVTLAVALCAGVLCALAPALQFGRRAGAPSMSRSRTVAGSTRRLGRGFAIFEIALGLVLVTVAAGVVQNLYRVLETPLGYVPSHLVTLSMHQPFGTDPAKLHRFYQQFAQRIATVPGVESVGAINALPPDNFSALRNADIAGRPLTAHHDTVTAEGRKITPDYLATMRIPLLAGRVFSDRDSEPGSPQVVVVNQSFAAKYFAGQNAVGQRLVVGSGLGGPLARIEIVGVAGNVQGTGGDLGGAPSPELYEPEQGYWPEMQFVVRTSLPAAVLAPALRAQLAALDPGAAFGSVGELAATLDHALAQPRLNSSLLSGLAGLALLLVLIGVYGVVAFSVAQRTREVAVRLALGSSRRAIFALLLGESASMLAGGMVLGVAGTAAAVRVLGASTGLPGYAGAAGITVAAAGLLAAAVLFATLLPARRAASIDPMQALRSE
jgi:putative ABC transport system permease protein